MPSSNPAWDPVGGVFIHHRGQDDPFGGEFETEEDCLKDIAAVYEDHLTRADLDGDIAYNFFVCQHGNIFEGRGYQRGEANSGDAGLVDGLGRNAGFYSICGLMRSNHTANETMLRAFRLLIQHLREEAPKKAGPRILPHSFNHPETECPGNLTMYAQQGSTIDPAAPWTGLADIYIFDAQKWVNATYKNAPGYIRCPENGRTGWSTVLSLTQGLQYEHGISPTVQNFGSGTFNAVKARNTLPGAEVNQRLIRIYNGALWCKGYWTSTNQAAWTGDSQSALEKLYRDAGLSYDDFSQRNKMWPHICKGLLRMDQFQLVPRGDINIQRIQQRLNSRYVAGIGIPAMSLVPCDGIYSRDVQQGFMMALQYELGIDLNSINGYFGPGTQAGLRGKGSGRLTGDLRWLFRGACYFNSPTMVPGTNGGQVPLMYRPDDIGTDTETSTHLEWVRAFQRFSQIPVTGTNDYTTWAQLLVSCGDTARPATGCDCITEITAARGKQLKDAGYQIVGRYLDEHLPPSDPDYLGKALKPGEPQTILNAGLRFFPLFQYNGTQLENFTYQKGYDQGTIAHQKAVEYRIPSGTCIYFAVDYDALDEDIDSNVKPYFQGVKAALAELGNRYAFGVYGSRNVCIRVSLEVGARWSLVSGMSWGYSGNLGFPLPENWSFNQIREYEVQPGWGLDHDIWRQGADPGVSALA
ncbi:glycoside hydrolase domain-containing protein [Planosporangium sp. 12N6]|uniref:glycoside hydrolase domain-containing protein n=1 Tax=Planosporangium spinosum TaxID=3402278 RepID=UPI003CF51E8A